MSDEGDPEADRLTEEADVMEIVVAAATVVMITKIAKAVDAQGDPRDRPNMSRPIQPSNPNRLSRPFVKHNMYLRWPCVKLSLHLRCRQC